MNESSFDIFLDKKREVRLAHSEQLNHTSIIGIKRLSDEDVFFAQFIHEAIRLRNVSSTFFVSSRHESFRIYSLAKKMKRRVVMISPSFVPFSGDLHADNMSRIKNYINYSNYIYNNYIIIVDVEYIKNKLLSERFIELMLNIIEKSILDTEKTALKKHNIYFDDVHLYLDYISELVYYGREYNVSLFFFIRNCVNFFGEKNIKALVDSCGNRIVLSNASEFDKDYFVGKEASFLDANSIVVINDDKKINKGLELDDDLLKNYFKLSDKDIKSLTKTLRGKISKYEKKVLATDCDAENIDVTNDLDFKSCDDIAIISKGSPKLEYQNIKNKSRNNTEVYNDTDIGDASDTNREKRDMEKRKNNLFGRQMDREELIIDSLFDDIDDDFDC